MLNTIVNNSKKNSLHVFVCIEDITSEPMIFIGFSLKIAFFISHELALCKHINQILSMWYSVEKLGILYPVNFIKITPLSNKIIPFILCNSEYPVMY